MNSNIVTPCEPNHRTYLQHYKKTGQNRTLFCSKKDFIYTNITQNGPIAGQSTGFSAATLVKIAFGDKFRAANSMFRIPNVGCGLRRLLGPEGLKWQHVGVQNFNATTWPLIVFTVPNWTLLFRMGDGDSLYATKSAVLSTVRQLINQMKCKQLVVIILTQITTTYLLIGLLSTHFS